MINYREQIVHGNNRYPIACYKLDNAHIRHQMAFHWHPEHEILFLKKGRLSLVLNQDEYGAVPGIFSFFKAVRFIEVRQQMMRSIIALFFRPKRY